MADPSTTPRVVQRRDVPLERRQELFEQLLHARPGNAKWRRQTLEMDLDAACVEFVQELAVRALDDPGGSLRRFLNENPWPSWLSDLELSEEERARIVIMNAIKQWVSKESAYMDTLLGGGQFRKKLRALALERNCPVCGAPLRRENLELHHTARDGRPPVPLCKTCHANIEGWEANDIGSDAADAAAASSSVVDLIRQIRRDTHSSWSNLSKAVRVLQGLPHETFGTSNVRNASLSIVRRMLRETGLSEEELQEILDELEGV